MTTIVIRNGSLDEAMAVEAAIPEFTAPRTRATYTERLSGRPNLILVAIARDRPVGFKLGYETEPSTFYSWAGGVVPEHRRSGIARDLLVRQEAWARDNGYERVRVKSKNEFSNMLRLLIGAGYRITGTEGSGQGLKILFERTLSAQGQPSAGAGHPAARAQDAQRSVPGSAASRSSPIHSPHTTHTP